MKARFFKKTFPILLTFLFALALFIVMPVCNDVKAEDDGHGYYYEKISPDAKRMYDAIGAMHSGGTLKSGNGKYDLISNNVLTTAQLQSYSSSSTVMTAFGAARDAYYLDHPELFYIDFSRLTINVGTRNGEYVATLGSGRAENYYIENGFSSESAVNAAIAQYDAALSAVAEAASTATDDAAKITAVNEALCEKIDYTFCSTTDAQGNTVYQDGAAHIRNAYGALVNGKAVCEGYATAFKCVMDKLGIECVIVQGYASNDGGLEPHAWNYVNLDGSWYGVDVTWNDSAVNNQEYLLRGKALMSAEHIPDGVISASGYKFVYPELNPEDYGFKADGGLDIEVSYTTTSSGGKSPVYKISKYGKNAQQLEEDGEWLAYRMCYLGGAASDEFIWSDWYNMRAQQYGSIEHDGYTEFIGINTYVLYVQFALIDYAPDKPSIVGEGFTGPLDSYDPAVLKDSNFISQTEVKGNEGFDTHIAPPYVKSATPSVTTTLDAATTYDISVTYTERLVEQDRNAEVGMEIISLSADAKNYSEISDVVWDSSAPDKVTFKFTPSGMYNHRNEVYTLIPTNLVGEGSGKKPMSVTYYIKNENIVCNKVYGDGRLYINSYGSPSLVSAGDLSTTGWKADGNYVSENQRSQLMLVASKPSQKQQDAMINDVIEKANISQNDVMSSQTFEIEMNICKNIVEIPDGSTVQMAFGFPEGYGPEDEGVVFKVYHFRRGADGKIDYSKTEEIECVVTEFGLVVNVSDFSPFAVVALKKDSVQAQRKSVYARALSFGGSVSNSAAGGSTACLVGEGESVTFTLAPEQGYKVECVTLNGTDIAFTDNKVVLDYVDLQDRSELDVRFVANTVAEYEQQEGISVVYPSVKVDSVSGGEAQPQPQPAAPTPTTPEESGLAWYIYLIIVLCALLVIGGAVVCVIVLKKRKNRT